MGVFLCGGGAGAQCVEAYEKFKAIIDMSKPMLYVPLALPAESYDSCLEWITGEMAPYGIVRIEMVRSAAELAGEDLTQYSAMFIGGGNTYKLLAELKESGCFAQIREYINNDGIVFGGSAGAIIFGEDIDTCKYADKNEVALEDTKGFDVLKGISLLCHFTNESAAATEANRNYLLELSKERKIIALPEEVTLFVHNNGYEVIGDVRYYVFENGSERFV